MSRGAQDWSRTAIGWFCNLCESYGVEGDPIEEAVTETMYTIPSGQTLYLTGVAMDISNAHGSISYGELKVTNAGDVAQYGMISLRLADGHEDFPSRTFPLPIRIVSGWKIKITSGNADVLVTGYINGFLV